MNKPKTTDKKYYSIMDGKGGEFNQRMYIRDLEEYKTLKEERNYYTPKYADFHLGFEYQHYDEKCDSWMNCFYLTMYDQRGDSKLEELNMGNERVKYLDIKDFKECGFIKTCTYSTDYSDELQYEKGKFAILYNHHTNKMTVLRSEPKILKEPIVVFNGTIRNKSEFKILQEWLGIA